MSTVPGELEPPLDWLPAGFEAHVVETNGTRLFVAHGGSGQPLVLLHGWPQTSRAWARVMPELAETHHVVAPDLRGTGRSERPDGGYAKVDQALDVRGVLDALGIEGPATVVGHDIGAMVALAWAASRPADVSALVLVDAVLPGLGLEEAMDVAKGGMWHFGFFMAPRIPEMLLDGHEAQFIGATFSGMSNPGTFSQEDLDYYAGSYTGVDRLRGGFGHYRTLLDDGVENRRLLERPLPMPVLAIGGQTSGGDQVGVPLQSHAVRVTSIAAPTGHFVAEEAPAWFVSILTDFLDRGSTHRSGHHISRTTR